MSSFFRRCALAAATTIMTVGALAQPPTGAGDLAKLAARVQVLEDREDIRALILAYGTAHDHRDYRTFASLFAKEGEWVGGLGSAKGPDAIRAHGSHDRATTRSRTAPEPIRHTTIRSRSTATAPRRPRSGST
jgi:hypothetical protein